MIPTYGGVYFVRCGRFVKIGHTENIRRRMASLQAIEVEPLQLVHHEHIADASERLERETWLHEHFASRRVRGELFDVSDAEVRAAPDSSRRPLSGSGWGGEFARRLLGR